MRPISRYSIILALSLVVNTSFGQEKSSIRVDLSYHQLNNNLPALTALIRTRIDRRFQPVENVQVDFYTSEVDAANLLGSAVSDTDGKATLQLGDAFKPQWDTTSVFEFIASVVNNPNYEDKDDDIEITKAEVSIELLEDEERQVKVTIMKFLEDGTKEPAEGVSAKLQVKRTFSMLPIGDDNYETDEDGEIVASFPEDIPGGTDGNLVIVAFIEDDSDLGNLKAEKEAPWGSAIAEREENSFGERSLWAARDRAPFWLLIFPNLIILGIWGTMIYLVLLIFKIRKIGKTS